jgi:hypothetical protein
MGDLVSFDQIPDDVAADVSGLTPARAKLARHAAWISHVEAELARLTAGKARLETEIAKANAARDDLEARVNEDAASLVDRIRGGLEWALSTFGGPQVLSLDARLVASRHHAAVASKALVATIEEIGRVEAVLARLRERKSAMVAGATREAAAGLFEDYAIASECLRESMIRLAALENFHGVERQGRVVAALPDFDWTTGPDRPVVAPAREIAKAKEVWARFAEALENDPRAPADLLAFPAVDPAADNNIPYENLHPLERRIVDARGI